MNQKIDLQPAYVLHTRDYRDTSLLVDLLTLDYGILRAVARGVRGSRSNRRALLQPLQPLLVTVAGKGELKSLSQYEASAAGFNLRGDHLFSAMYINELLCRLLQAHESHPQIYRLYQSTLLSLMKQSAIEEVLRRFEFRLLTELGYAPDMMNEADNGADLRAESDYEFDYLRGFILLHDGHHPAPAAVYSGADIMAMGRLLMQDCDEEFAPEMLAPAKRFMRQALRPHLGSRPLNSRQLFISKPKAAAACLPPEGNKG
ncbi:MAG: DNA repair protein RecO [Pseudohongiella sp.]|nr:DNA repair protein RecO [Pseudohongiella sp.]